MLQAPYMVPDGISIGAPPQDATVMDAFLEQWYTVPNPEEPRTMRPHQENPSVRPNQAQCVAALGMPLNPQSQPLSLSRALWTKSMPKIRSNTLTLAGSYHQAHDEEIDLVLSLELR